MGTQAKGRLQAFTRPDSSRIYSRATFSVALIVTQFHPRRRIVGGLALGPGRKPGTPRKMNFDWESGARSPHSFPRLRCLLLLPIRSPPCDQSNPRCTHNHRTSELGTGCRKYEQRPADQYLAHAFIPRSCYETVTRAAFSNRRRRQQSLRMPCAHSISLRGGAVSSCLMSGFTCSRWQREPSGPQTELTLSQERQLPSGPRSPGPPRVPQVALAIDGRAMTRAAARARTLSIVINFFVDVARFCCQTAANPAYGFFVALSCSFAPNICSSPPE